MEKTFTLGRLLFEVAITAFGIEHLLRARFEQAVAFIIPGVPGNPFFAYLTGIALLAAGLSIAANSRARLTAILLGFLFLLCVLLLWVPRVAAHPFGVSIRTCAFETLAMCGSALTLAGCLPPRRRNSKGWGGALDKLIGLGPFLFAVSSVVFGVDHFVVLGVIASLVPTWIPGGLFWAYFTGSSFIADDVSMATQWMARWAAILLGAMLLFWFLLLHAPRVVRASHNPDEWSSAFIALGMCGGSWISAWYSVQRCQQNAK